jgi:hypothetical protein
VPERRHVAVEDPDAALPVRRHLLDLAEHVLVRPVQDADDQLVDQRRLATPHAPGERPDDLDPVGGAEALDAPASGLLAARVRAAAGDQEKRCAEGHP